RSDVVVAQRRDSHANRFGARAPGTSGGERSMRLHVAMTRLHVYTVLASVLLTGTAWAAAPIPASSIHAQGGPAFFVTTPSAHEPWDIGYAVGAGVDAGIALGMSATFDIGYAHFGRGDAALLGRVGDAVGNTATDAEG